MIQLWIRDAAGNRDLRDVAEISDIPGGSPSTALVDSTSIAKFTVSGDSNEPNLTQTLTTLRLDSGITVASNQVTNNIGGDHVIVDVHEYFQENQSNTFARINPGLELVKNGIVVAKSASAYQRHAGGHDSSSNGITYTDESPSVGDVWFLRSQQESNQNDVLDIDLGHVTFRIVEKINVLIP